MKPAHNAKTLRNRKICRAYFRDGLLMPQIAAKHGISKQAVHAIISRELKAAIAAAKQKKLA